MMRFYKVMTETTKEEDNKIKLTTKANGRVMIMMDKSIFSNIITRQAVGNHLNDPSFYWVNLMEKAYAIYLSQNNLIDKDFSFFNIYGGDLGHWYEKGSNDLSAVEGGLSVVPMTAITGKKGNGYLVGS